MYKIQTTKPSGGTKPGGGLNPGGALKTLFLTGTGILNSEFLSVFL